MEGSEEGMTYELDVSYNPVEYSIDRYDWAKHNERVIQGKVVSLKWDINSLSVKDADRKVKYQIKVALRTFNWPSQKIWIEDETGRELIKFDSKQVNLLGTRFETKILDPQDRLLAICMMNGSDPWKGKKILMGPLIPLAERFLQDPQGNRLASARYCSVATMIPKYKIVGSDGNVIATLREGSSKEVASITLERNNIDSLLIIGMVCCIGLPVYFAQGQEEYYSRTIQGWPYPILPE